MVKTKILFHSFCIASHLCGRSLLLMTKPGNMALAGVKVLELEGEPETLESTICLICYPKSQVVDIFYILGIFGCIPIPRFQSTCWYPSFWSFNTSKNACDVRYWALPLSCLCLGRFWSWCPGPRLKRRWLRFEEQWRPEFFRFLTFEVVTVCRACKPQKRFFEISQHQKKGVP